MLSRYLDVNSGGLPIKLSFAYLVQYPFKPVYINYRLDPIPGRAHFPHLYRVADAFVAKFDRI
ncbi:hypothetical protein H6G54_03185 [Anabaena cylindrica FACHB-243]|uniref:hypothetical protein n=1 Tax=Anabaena TaxID=1163 RepID=UPI0002D5767D|nr:MULTISPECIES: hypothetical protein [Anabaena]MBD2416729.1 hypothetical protein [Anabaena cylindrica FACHB-243]MBY5285029.1 hypothetical protein [Anabaena sp. CCAP 1446/1C]MBY5310334.1 hypothetical protein [Anabaena sp. CCAP 1446/1C]MCM2409850.1 hypothetical protein [Anabaena sp. CCAP 1446/1C]